LDPEHEAEALALLRADGDVLEALAALADGLRRAAVGEEVTYVVNRNINFSNICHIGCRFCAYARSETDPEAFRLSPARVADLAAEAWLAGATEVCLQGGIDPGLPVAAYPDMLRAIRASAPGLHLHAYSPMEVFVAARRARLGVEDWLRRLREAGLDSMPGTAAEVFDDEVRQVLTRAKLSAQEWISVVGTAHDLGIRSTATMMYGHVDEPVHWLRHVRSIAQLQDRTGGFTEFVPLPFVHHRTPIFLAGVSRPGATRRENRVVHAMARVLLHGRIDNVQCSWVKVGNAGVTELLRGGVNDLGGTLMEETICRSAGADSGSARTVEQLTALAAAAGRPARRRTTLYGPTDV
ncbi:MAG: 5-amino-6-(D-ribitylamino)uracil--L-tyrosine 4-hydroxyphenyl transferase CofH, partial [Dactylosporangium sp.]|nr:5-amino-6-(D-ribitylamino)uracil--L-tyrosine 4-hydroxyphenyl transferase CofH [Dactylosporangium sp.]NNJ63414.1 5-amino-6-(D-ribitylamino)uracil--L-tyrosine 4-hydroxyphenyl transferase CofH [Dactylosporangium sp.]